MQRNIIFIINEHLLYLILIITLKSKVALM